MYKFQRMNNRFIQIDRIDYIDVRQCGAEWELVIVFNDNAITFTDTEEKISQYLTSLTYGEYTEVRREINEKG